MSANIIVNGRPLSLGYNKLTYDQVVVLAFGPTDRDDIVTVTHFNQKTKTGGTLVPGQSVKLGGGVIFTAVRTNKA